MAHNCIDPPIGTKPNWLWIRQTVDKDFIRNRIFDIDGAILRYLQAGLEINPEWITERNQLVKAIKD